MQEENIGVLWPATTWESLPFTIHTQIPQNASLTVQFLSWFLFYYLIAVGIFTNRNSSAECCTCFVITKMVTTPLNLQFK